MATKKTGSRKKTSSSKPRSIKVVDGDGPVVEAPEGTSKSRKQSIAKTDSKEKHLSALDAAAKVLRESDEPLNTKQMIELMEAKGYWKSPGGKTPHATLYSGIIREIATKGAESRFRKTDRGRFAP